MKNKRGGFGDLIMSVGATISIVLILVLFVLGAGVTKKFSKNEAGLVVYSEKGVAIDNIFSYMKKYERLVKIKFFLEKGYPLDVAIAEAKNEG